MSPKEWWFQPPLS